MKISELTISEICHHLRENEAALSEADIAYIQGLKLAGINYIKSHTGIYGMEEPDDNGRMLDDYDDLTIALLAIISQMYDNRQLTITGDKINPIVSFILGMHDYNLIPGTPGEDSGEDDGG